jgi:hypothetical protein
VPSPRRAVRLVLAAGVLAGGLVVVKACGTAPSSPSPVLSNYERSTGDTIRRDCGYSSPLPGRPGWSIWLFCDTAVMGADAPAIKRLILGTGTAADGPYQAGQAPAPLSELPTPPTRAARPSSAAPQPFLPAPQSLQLPGTILPCTGHGAYPAAWISGVTRAPPPAAGTLLISYDDYCVSGNGAADGPAAAGPTAEGPTAEGFGLAEYDPASNLLGPVTTVFSTSFGLPLLKQQVLGSPVLGRDGYLYLFGFCRAAPAPAGCGRGQVFLARTVAAAAYWSNPFSYQYWTGDGWSPQPAAAGSLVPAGHPLGISVGDFAADGQGLVMIEQTSLAGDFQAWRARSPAGPWRRILTGRVPCTAGAEAGAEGLCRALIGHSELSTRSRLLISYYDPGNDHVDVAAYQW